MPTAEGLGTEKRTPAASSRLRPWLGPYHWRHARRRARSRLASARRAGTAKAKSVLARITHSRYRFAGERKIGQGDDVLDQKIALITGGSAGIGLAVARQLSARGTRVALVARTEKTLRDAAQELDGVAFVCDMNDLPSVSALPARVVERMGALDIVVNNAGLHHRGPLLSIEPLALGDMITVNLAAPVVLCRAAVPLLRKPGSIVNVASLAGMVPMPLQVTYGASKAGLRAFSRALCDELAGSGVTVSMVSPGPVDTGFFGAELERVADVVFSQPMSTAEQVAKAIVRCIDEGTPEIALPWLSGKLCTLGYLSPVLTRLLRPAIEKRGARNKRIYIERKRAAL